MDTLPAEAAEDDIAASEIIEDVIEEDIAEETPPSVEDLAKQMGWNPDFEGENAKSADQYILDTRNFQDKYYKEVRDLKGQLSQIGETTTRIVEADRAKQRAELDAEYKARWEANDYAGAKEVLEQQRAIEAVPQQQQGPSPEAAKWAAERPWFNSDPLATQTAHEAAAAAAASGKTPAEQFEYADKQVRLRHPHLFTPSAKKQPAVNGNNSRAVNQRQQGKKTAADLPSGAREAMSAMVKAGLTTEDGYVQNYFDKGGRK